MAALTTATIATIAGVGLSAVGIAQGAKANRAQNKMLLKKHRPNKTKLLVGNADRPSVSHKYSEHRPSLQHNLLVVSEARPSPVVLVLSLRRLVKLLASRLAWVSSRTTSLT